MDVASSITDVLYRLGFVDSTDIALSGSWVTVTELYQWADEAVQKIAYASGIFLTYDTSITVVSATAVYNLPASHVFTLAVWLGSGLLRLTTVRDLFALDNVWNTASGPSTRACLDAGGVGTITLYPNPTVGGTLKQVCEEFPATVALGSSTVALPTVLQDWLTYEMIAGARGKESEAAMPEMSAHARARCDMYEQIIGHLYGQGH